MSTRRKTEAEIHAEIRRLRHQLDRHKLTRTQTALVAAQREIERLTAELRSRPSAGKRELAPRATRDSALRGSRDRRMDPMRTPREMAIAWAEQERKHIEADR
jgi:hypothetical protein